MTAKEKRAELAVLWGLFMDRPALSAPEEFGIEMAEKKSGGSKGLHFIDVMIGKNFEIYCQGYWAGTGMADKKWKEYHAK
jgi:hypothetical protein